MKTITVGILCSMSLLLTGCMTMGDGELYYPAASPIYIAPDPPVIIHHDHYRPGPPPVIVAPRFDHPRGSMGPGPMGPRPQMQAPRPVAPRMQAPPMRPSAPRMSAPPSRRR